MFSFNSSQRFVFRLGMTVCMLLAMSVASHAQEDENPLKSMSDDETKEFYATDGLTVINFDEDVDGEKLRTKQVLDDLYVSKGVAFSDDANKSNVTTFNYNCGGISGDKCAGIAKPPYSGIVRITFHEPGDSEKKATISQFGLFLSAVKPNGTKVEAYDVDDKLIGSLATTKGNTDFIGAKTEQKIHYLRIVPNEMLDPDFAFDDLAFDKPKPID